MVEIDIIELLLGSTSGVIGMYLFYNILNTVVNGIENKMIQQVDALILVSNRQDKILERLQALEEGLGH